MSETLETIIRWGVLSLYFGSLLGMTIYGCHRWYLVWLYLRHRRDTTRPRERFEEPPRLTVQLPLYNEMYVAERLIDAVCALDYPRERLEVQVLDDSTDETTAVVAQVVERHPLRIQGRRARSRIEAGQGRPGGDLRRRLRAPAGLRA
jgi:cellulose synthase/poly-beta-1,6-N-acetylglucosamine synthase-like glycosyltransferase